MTVAAPTTTAVALRRPEPDHDAAGAAAGGAGTALLRPHHQTTVPRKRPVRRTLPLRDSGVPPDPRPRLRRSNAAGPRCRPLAILRPRWRRLPRGPPRARPLTAPPAAPRARDAAAP